MIVVGKPKRRGCGCVKLGGCSSAGPPRRARQLGGLEDDIIPARAEIEGADRELGTKIRALGKELAEQLPDVKNPAAFLQAWNAFVQEYNGWTGKWYLDRWGRRNEVIALRSRFNRLVDWWRSLAGAGATTTPTYKRAETEVKSPLAGLPPALGLPSWVLPVGIAVAGLVIVGPMVAPLVTAALAASRTRRAT